MYGMQDGLFSDGRLSPNGSFATSMNDLGAYMPTIGFASNLSHTVIREHDDESVRGSDTGSLSTLDEMNDDELALLGPPWAKEGMLWYKPYWESAGKRAKKGDWKQHFVVVQKGDLLMFTFGEKGGGSSSFSLPVGGSVGGGNWLVSISDSPLRQLKPRTTPMCPEACLCFTPSPCHCQVLAIRPNALTSCPLRYLLANLPSCKQELRIWSPNGSRL